MLLVDKVIANKMFVSIFAKKRKQHNALSKVLLIFLYGSHKGYTLK